MTIPLFKPSCSALEIELVTNVLKSGWWGQGPVTAKLEDKFSEKIYGMAGQAVAVNSGTAALELAARQLFTPGDTVIVPALTFVSTALAMHHAQLNVVYADIREDTLTIDWDDVKRILEEEHLFVTGVVPVWYGGYVDAIPSWVFDEMLVLEDCAHAAGSDLAGKQGDAAAWSFHAVKNLAAGDGGMITTRYPNAVNNLKALRWCGIDRSTWERDNAKGYGWDYNIVGDGEKAHMNDLTAAVALAQFYRLDSMNQKRYELLKRYWCALHAVPWLRFESPASDSSNHMFTVRVAAEDRDAFIEHTLSKGVSAGVHYKPLHHYDKLPGIRRNLPVTDAVWQELITLPLYPDMTPDDQAKVIDAIKSFK